MSLFQFLNWFSCVWQILKRQITLIDKSCDTVPPKKKFICSNTLCIDCVTRPLRLSAASCIVDVHQLLNPSLLSVSGNKFAALFRLSGH